MPQHLFLMTCPAMLLDFSESRNYGLCLSELRESALGVDLELVFW